nr:MAG TPA: hypothetical protein [Caudoviricetes sp.]
MITLGTLQHFATSFPARLKLCLNLLNDLHPIMQA